MTKPLPTTPDKGNEPVNDTSVAASANAVIDSLHDFSGVIGRIQEGVAEIDAHTMLAKGMIDAHAALAENRIDAHIQQRMTQALQSLQASSLDMDRVEKELQDRRRRRGYSNPNYDDY